MIITCPSCNHTGNLPLNTSASVGAVTCPKCKHRFPIEIPRVDKIPPATASCPKCGHIQQESESCTACGIIFTKYRPPETPPYTPPIPPDVWAIMERPKKTSSFGWLFTRRSIGSTRAIAALLVFGLWFAVDASSRAHRHAETVASTMAAVAQAEGGGPARVEAGSPARKAQRDPAGETEEDRRVLADLRLVAGKAREIGDLCLAECRSNLSRLNNEPIPDREATDYNPILNNSVQEMQKQFHEIRRRSFFYEAYYASVSDLVGSVTRLNRLRLNPDPAYCQRQLADSEREYQAKLMKVESKDPRQ
jgi:hypothetical protein